MRSNKKKSVLAKLPRCFKRHRARLGWAAVGLLVGGPLGWLVGSYLSCSRAVSGCELRADSIEAAGTWFGAIGTILAVLVAAQAYQAEQDKRRTDQRQAERSAREHESSVKEEADRVRISCDVEKVRCGQVRGYVVSVTNDADHTSLTRLQGRDFAGPLVSKRAMWVGQIVTTKRGSGDWEATLDTPTDKSAFEKWCVQQVEIMFMMHGRYWRRVGYDDVELIERWDAEGSDSPDWSRL